MYKEKSRIFSALSLSFMDTKQSNYKLISSIIIYYRTRRNLHCQH